MNKRSLNQHGGTLADDATAILEGEGYKGPKELEQFLFSDKFILNPKGTAYNDVIFGEYTFQKHRDMSRQYHLVAFKTSNTEEKTTLLTVSDY